MKRMHFALPRRSGSMTTKVGLVMLALVGVLGAGTLAGSTQPAALETEGPWTEVSNVPECEMNGRVCAEWPTANQGVWLCCVPLSAIGGSNRQDCQELLLVVER